MNWFKSALLVVVISLTACLPIPATGGVVDNPQSISNLYGPNSCQDFSGIWLGQLTDEIEGTVFSNQWGLILEQFGCQASGQLAVDPSVTSVFCQVEGNTLICSYDTGDNCINKISLELSGRQVSGKLFNCMSKESRVVLEKSDDFHLEQSLIQNKAPAFPANPTGLSCWVYSPYKDGYHTIFCDKFDDNSNRWPVGSGTGPLALTGTSIEKGKLIVDLFGISADGKESAVLQFLPPLAYADDFLFQASARIESDSQQAAWGLAFEGDNNGNLGNKYLFLLSKSGHYSLVKFEDSLITPIIAPRASGLINLNSDNIIMIVNEGSNYDFYINGTIVRSMELDPLADTAMMLAVSVDAAVNSEFRFDDLFIQSPQTGN